MDFSRLNALAQPVITRARDRLPAEVRSAAARLPVCCEPVPNDAMLAEGWEADILGLFVGHEHGGDFMESSQPLPPQILLFLENIWDYAEHDEAIFRDEVRLTYLHELGHYLGWDEEEVARRGLD
ncbi:MAG: metallopeptidase family protein [Candidatus Didemnitutus sp.]|nr:metallopeptidase family protein [Candidatus Didemnitutus sp.]